MSVTFYEKFKSRSTQRGGQTSVSREWTAIGSDDDGEIEAAIIGTLPGLYDNGVYELPAVNYSFDQEGYRLWNVKIDYGTRQTSGDGMAFSFDTGGGSAKITQSKETIGSYALSGTAPNFYGAIGVNDKSIDGCEIFIPSYKWTEKYTVPDSSVDGAYRLNLFYATGTTNAGSFRDFAAGEVLFEGCRGQKESLYGPWELTFSFAASPNATGLTVGGITGIAKKGWEYLWVRYEEYEDATAHALSRRPVAVYIERVYDETNYTYLGIGS